MNHFALLNTDRIVVEIMISNGGNLCLGASGFASYRTLSQIALPSTGLVIRIALPIRKAVRSSSPDVQFHRTQPLSESMIGI
ncbi:hypothetical protein COH20_003509 [Aspergillus flavus]|nr:hypothetical protein COH20_003509 [Aspergillus flavus]RAQ73217.1 hypothetical protein COH21_009924 [Aspergillus flavus]